MAKSTFRAPPDVWFNSLYRWKHLINFFWSLSNDSSIFLNNYNTRSSEPHHHNSHHHHSHSLSSSSPPASDDLRRDASLLSSEDQLIQRLAQEEVVNHPGLQHDELHLQAHQPPHHHLRREEDVVGLRQHQQHVEQHHDGGVAGFEAAGAVQRGPTVSSLVNIGMYPC